MLQVHIDIWHILSDLENAFKIFWDVSIEDGPFLQDVSRKRCWDACPFFDTDVRELVWETVALQCYLGVQGLFLLGWASGVCRYEVYQRDSLSASSHFLIHVATVSLSTWEIFAMALLFNPSALSRRLWARARALGMVSCFMISTKVCRWFSVRGRTYRTIATPVVRCEISQKLSVVEPIWVRHYTAKLLL